MKIIKHRPLHITQTENPYFITGRTYFGLPHFDTNDKKGLALLSAINLACENYGVKLDGWVVLDNHYHILVRPPGCEWDIGIADKSARPDERNRNREGNSELARDKNAGKPATSSTRSSDFSRDQQFKIGKFVGAVHGKSSSLLKKIADKSVTPDIRNGEFTREPSIWADWWDMKYWENIRIDNINMYGKRSQLAEKRRGEKFRKLLKEIEDKATGPGGGSLDLSEDYKKLDELVTEDFKVWYQYIDRIMRDENDYFIHLNYIHQNPVKHGFVKQMSKYEFSSIHSWIKSKGKEYTVDLFREFPIRDFSPNFDDFN